MTVKTSLTKKSELQCVLKIYNSLLFLIMTRVTIEHFYIKHDNSLLLNLLTWVVSDIEGHIKNNNNIYVEFLIFKIKIIM